MRSAMDEVTFMKFYQNTVLGYSNVLKRHICRLLEKEHLITFDKQRSVFDNEQILYFEKRQTDSIISQTTIKPEFINFYENWEFIKLYKYSVPFFYELPDNLSVEEILRQKGLVSFNREERFEPEYILNTSLKEIKPMYLCEDKKVFLKFVLQKSYVAPDTFEVQEYRYPIIIYFDTENRVMEIRYDAARYGSFSSNQIGVYEQLVDDCIDWLKKELTIELYECNHMDIIKVVNNKEDDQTRMFKQMMNMSSGGAAELTASESEDYVLPFIGELRELINENEELFNQSEKIKDLLIRYLNDKEATASYPYIYIKRVKAVETESYIVKITFDYLNHRYTLLQHNIGECKELGMERMNDVIAYLCRNRAFTKGERI